MVAYPSLDALDAVCDAFPEAVRRYHNHFKIGGCKLFLDGSPQGRTAWMRTPYQGAADGYCGYGTMTDEAVRDALLAAWRSGMQPLAHCNGDAAAAQYLSAAAAIEREHPDFRGLRPVMIHAQLLDTDQMDETARLGVTRRFSSRMCTSGATRISKTSASSGRAASARQRPRSTGASRLPSIRIRPSCRRTCWARSGAR